MAAIGKFSVADVFDAIGDARDPRSGFMNWSLVDAGTFDYAADAWGSTYGAALEWYQSGWVAREGLFDLSLMPNSADLDSGFQSSFSSRSTSRAPGSTAMMVIGSIAASYTKRW